MSYDLFYTIEINLTINFEFSSKNLSILLLSSINASLISLVFLFIKLKFFKYNAVLNLNKLKLILGDN